MVGPSLRIIVRTSVAAIEIKPPLPAAFVRIGWSSLLAMGADQVALAAAPLAAVLVFAIPAGLLADRLSRRALLVVAESLRSLGLATVLVLAWSGFLDLRRLAPCSVGEVRRSPTRWH